MTNHWSIHAVDLLSVKDMCL